MRDRPVLRLWEHIFDGLSGDLAILSGRRNGDKLDAPTTKYYAFPAAAVAAAGQMEQDSAKGLEVYVCARLLTQRRRIKPNAAPIQALYADVDHGVIPDDFPQPTALIESSPGRYQGYWRLTGPIDPQRAEQLNKRLAAGIPGADPSGADLTQVLRVPGLPNRKYDGTPLVRLVFLRDEAYDPDELDRILPALPEVPKVEKPRRDASLQDDRRGEWFTDDAILSWCFESPRFTRYWHGDLSECNGDASSADLSVVNLLAFRSGDRATVDRLFQQSYLMRDKWDEKHSADGRTYGEMTIDKAFAGRTAYWEPPAQLSLKKPHVDASLQDDRREIPADLLARIEALEIENAALKERNAALQTALDNMQQRSQLEHAMTRNKALKAEREVGKQLARIAESCERRNELPDDAYFKIALDDVGENVGKSGQSVSSNIRSMAEKGLLDFELRTEPTPITNEAGMTVEIPVPRMYVNLKGTANEFRQACASYEPPEDAETWGGDRREITAKHPGDDIIITETVVIQDSRDYAVLHRHERVRIARKYVVPDDVKPEESPPEDLDMTVATSNGLNDSPFEPVHVNPRFLENARLAEAVRVQRPENECWGCGATLYDELSKQRHYCRTCRSGAVFGVAAAGGAE